MTLPFGVRSWLLFLSLVSLATDAVAARRVIRVDGFGDTWIEFTIGSAGCPGTTAGATAANTLIQKLGFTFSGRANTSFLVDDYCQVAQPGTLTQTNYFYADEQGLAALFGDNPGDAITGIRYSMLDRDRFDFETPPTGFQWAYYSFPNGVTVVGLYGLELTTLDDTSYIKAGTTFVWKGSQGYDGHYFCFRAGTYIGPWNGDLGDTSSACLQALQTGDSIFASGFDGTAGVAGNCIDIDGATSNAAWRSGDPHNTVMNVAIGAGNALRGVAIDATVEAFSPSWLTESAVAFSASDDLSGAGAVGVALSTAEVAGLAQNLTFGPALFADSGTPNVPAGADGVLRVERYETYSDASVDPDSVWSTSTTPVTCPGIHLLCTNQPACDAAVAATVHPPRA